MPKTPWDRLKARPAPGAIHVVVETPRGSRNKYKYDEKLGLFRLNRVLFAGASFPYDFGYIPYTRGGDGDPLDVLLLMDEPAYPGCVVRARAIGVLLAKKEGKENHRLIAVSTDAKTWSQHRDRAVLPFDPECRWQGTRAARMASRRGGRACDRRGHRSGRASTPRQTRECKARQGEAPR